MNNQIAKEIEQIAKELKQTYLNEEYIYNQYDSWIAVATAVKKMVFEARIDQWGKVVLRGGENDELQKKINKEWLNELTTLNQKLENQINNLQKDKKLKTKENEKLDLLPCPFCGDELYITEFKWCKKEPKWVVLHGSNPICPLTNVIFVSRHSKIKAIEHANLRSELKKVGIMLYQQ